MYIIFYVHSSLPSIFFISKEKMVNGGEDLVYGGADLVNGVEDVVNGGADVGNGPIVDSDKPTNVVDPRRLS